jgi:hypothetical protein
LQELFGEKKIYRALCNGLIFGTQKSSYTPLKSTFSRLQISNARANFWARRNAVAILATVFFFEPKNALPLHYATAPLQVQRRATAGRKLHQISGRRCIFSLGF